MFNSESSNIKAVAIVENADTVVFRLKWKINEDCVVFNTQIAENETLEWGLSCPQKFAGWTVALELRTKSKPVTVGVQLISFFRYGAKEKPDYDCSAEGTLLKGNWLLSTRIIRGEKPVGISFVITIDKDKTLSKTSEVVKEVTSKKEGLLEHGTTDEETKVVKNWKTTAKKVIESESGTSRTTEEIISNEVVRKEIVSQEIIEEKPLAASDRTAFWSTGFVKDSGIGLRFATLNREMKSVIGKSSSISTQVKSGDNTESSESDITLLRKEMVAAAKETRYSRLLSNSDDDFSEAATHENFLKRNSQQPGSLNMPESPVIEEPVTTPEPTTNNARSFCIDEVESLTKENAPAEKNPGSQPNDDEKVTDGTKSEINPLPPSPLLKREDSLTQVPTPAPRSPRTFFMERAVPQPATHVGNLTVDQLKNIIGDVIDAKLEDLAASLSTDMSILLAKLNQLKTELILLKN